MFANTVLTTLALLVSPTHSTNPTNSTNPISNLNLSPKQGGPDEDMLPENINNTGTDWSNSIEKHRDSSSYVEDTEADLSKEDEKKVEDLKKEIKSYRELIDNKLAANRNRVKKFPIEEYLIMFTDLVLSEKRVVIDKMVSFFVTNYLDDPPKYIAIIETLYNSIIDPENNIDDSIGIIGEKLGILMDLFLEFLKQKKERAGNDILQEINNNEYYIRCVLNENDKIFENEKIRRAYAEILADSIKFCNSYDVNHNFCGKKYYAYESFKKRTFKLKVWFVQKCKVLKDNENLEKIRNAELGSTSRFTRILNYLKTIFNN